VDNFNLCFMIKQSCQVINNINTKLTQLEWIKKQLNTSSYEFPKFGTLFFALKRISVFILIDFWVIWTADMITEKSRGYFIRNQGPAINTLHTARTVG
jgi:hypothetical protein